MKTFFKLSFTLLTFLLILTTHSFADSTATSDSDASASAGAGFGGDVGSNNSSIGAPIPNSPNFGPVINYFGNPLPTENFQPLETVLMYSCWFNEKSLDSILEKSELIRSEMKLANTAEVADESDRWIKVVVSRDKYTSDNMTFLGFVTASSKSTNTTMVEVMAKAAKDAMDSGANVIHFTAQGAARDAFSKGWGIGFSSTQAKVSDQGKDTNVSSGGFGYSSAIAGMRDKPWLQGFALIDHNLKTPSSVLVE